MSEALTLELNGQPRTIASLTGSAPLDVVIQALELKSDRVAVELNGAIVRRTAWPETPVSNGDKLEIVHFVGGGAR